MFEKLRIKEHMEIAGSDGEHVGTVDKVESETIKLKKTDSADHQHHTLPFDMVDRVKDNLMPADRITSVRVRHRDGSNTGKYLD